MTGSTAGSVEREVLARITPTAETLGRVRATVERLVERAGAAARARSSPMVHALVAGSAARGTFLTDRLDIDLFLLFPPTLSRDALEREGMAIGGAILTDPITKYAEHPYLCGTFDGYRVDVVPGYAVTDPSQPLSAVDRTPFHQSYLLERQTPGLVDQVRLTKQFLRSLGIYGSEARTGGFSGYLTELLVHRFGSLQHLLATARGWRIPVNLLSAAARSPRVPDDVALLMDDPVDPHRNVATALSRRNLALFILGAGAYLDRPSAAAFELRPLRTLGKADAMRILGRRGTHVAVLGLHRPKAVDDILYPQLAKAERALADEAARLGFQVVGTASAAGDGRLVVLIEVEHGELVGVRVQDGPPPGIDRVNDFVEKWADPSAPVLQGPFVDATGRLAVETERAERHLEPLLESALDRLPLGKDLRGEVGTESWVRPLSAVDPRPELEAALGDLLVKRLGWLPPVSI